MKDTPKMRPGRRMVLSLKTTALCHEKCGSWCVVKPWMHKHAGQETTIQSIEDLVRYSLDSGYHYKAIVLSGGEPFLWSHIHEASRLLKWSGITDALTVYTNGLEEDAILLNAHYFDRVLLSVYDYNIDEIDRLHETLGNSEIKLKKNLFHAPKDAVDPLPADCGCSAYGMWQNRVTLCSSMEFYYLYMGWEMPADEITTLRPDYLDAFTDMDPHNREICRWCFGNRRVREKAVTVKNPGYGLWTMRS